MPAMVLLSSSIRYLGSWNQLVQWQQKGCECRRASWIQSGRRASTVVAVEKVDEALSELLDSKQSMQVSVYIDSLLDWNQRMNLTGVTEREAVMQRHITDSLALLPVLEVAYGECSSRRSLDQLKVIDVGTGAGLPGIVFAIARPAWQITLLESLQKRCNFLDYAVEKSGLSNVKVVRARAEDGGQDKHHREVYDVAVARAVAEMRVLSELCLPLVRVGGIFVAAKGPDPQEEVESAEKAINLLGASLLSISYVDSRGPFGQRTAIVCHKRKPTPAKEECCWPRNDQHPLEVRTVTGQLQHTIKETMKTRSPRQIARLFVAEGEIISLESQDEKEE